jgi:SCY1-like protein 2
MLTLLDHLHIFQEKCPPAVFREGIGATIQLTFFSRPLNGWNCSIEVMPLVYAALDAESSHVLERALKAVPPLCESALDYTTLKQVLLPKLTAVFIKTTVLSVKVNCLICFHALVETLDKVSLMF